MTAFHIALGVALIAVNSAAGLYGAFAWWRDLPAPGFWPLLRAGQVLVYGVDERFWKFHGVPAVELGGRDAWLSPALATEMGAKQADTLLLRLEKPGDIPAESIHGRKEDAAAAIRLTYKGELAAGQMGEFSLRPTQGSIRAIFPPCPPPLAHANSPPLTVRTSSSPPRGRSTPPTRKEVTRQVPSSRPSSICAGVRVSITCECPAATCRCQTGATFAHDCANGCTPSLQEREQCGVPPPTTSDGGGSSGSTSSSTGG